MKLTYRGVTYEYNPPVVETTAGAVAGKYRGLDWRFRKLNKPPVLQPRFNLTYRGIKYDKAGTIPTNPVIPESTLEGKARALMSTQKQMVKKRQQSLLSRAAAEIGLSAQLCFDL
jgi:hypothetical protein